MVPILFKVHCSEGKEVLAVCDKELCSKTLKGTKTEFHVSEHFYKGNKISVAGLKKKLHEFDNINIVGNKAVAIAIEENVASEESIIEIAGIKHVQIFKI